MKYIKFTIPIAPATKKNSQQIFINPRTKRPFIVPSKKYSEYLQKCRNHFKLLQYETINEKCNVQAVFYMRTRRRVDLVNLQEALLDMLVDVRILEDDNCNIVESMDGSRVLYDKESPRTEVRISINE